MARDVAGLVRSLAVRKELLDIWTTESETQSVRVMKRYVHVGYGGGRVRILGLGLVEKTCCLFHLWGVFLSASFFL